MGGGKGFGKGAKKGGGKGKKGDGKKGGKGKGKGKGGKKGGKGPAKVVVKAHERFSAVYIATGKDDSLVTKNMVPGESVYGEKRIDVVSETAMAADGKPEKVEYRVWNPFRSKLGASIVGGKRVGGD